MINTNTDMVEQIAESRGYDRGFSASRQFSHNLLNQLIAELKSKRDVAEEENEKEVLMMFQHQIDIVRESMLIIRRGSLSE